MEKITIYRTNQKEAKIIRQKINMYIERYKNAKTIQEKEKILNEYIKEMSNQCIYLTNKRIN